MVKDYPKVVARGMVCLIVDESLDRLRGSPLRIPTTTAPQQRLWSRTQGPMAGIIDTL